jgi:hypothetical protein
LNVDKDHGALRMKPADSGNKSASRAAIAERIAIDASRLVRVAKANDFPLLAYLIDMAVLEAWREAGECAPGAAVPDDSRPAHSG